MKFVKIITTIALLIMPTLLMSQVKIPVKKKVERKTEKEANKAVDKAIDDTFDNIFGRRKHECMDKI